MKSKITLRRFTTLANAIVLIVTAFCPTFTQNSQRSDTAGVPDLAWMAGDWQTTAGERVMSEEHWTRPAGSSMIGMSRTVAGDKTVSFEFLRLEQRGDAIYYVASPNGRWPATDFKLTRLSGQEAVFENPEHDFPKRIIYRRNSEGRLSATIDGGEGTRSQTFSFQPMAK